jgi:serine/threonine protein kinase
MIGEILGGRYKITHEVGDGGMATVYRAVDLTLQREVAIKILHPHLAKDKDLTQRFYQEASLAAKLDHPNIMKIFDYGNHSDKRTFIVAELINGVDFHKLQTAHMRKNGEAFSPVLVAMVCEESLKGIAHAHLKNVVHRDIKPDNIMVCNDGQVKLMDFGIAKNTLTSITMTGHFLGSPSYASPEQIKGEDVDRRSDLYSVGVILYEALTNRLPFTGLSAPEVMMKICTGKYAPLKTVKPSVPPALDHIVNRLLQTDMNRRYRRAEDVLEKLREYLSELEVFDSKQGISDFLQDERGFLKKHTAPKSTSRAKALISSPSEQTPQKQPSSGQQTQILRLGDVPQRIQEPRIAATQVSAQSQQVQVNHAQVNQAQVNHAQVNHAQVNHAQVNHAQVNHAQVNHAQGNHAQALLQKAEAAPGFLQRGQPVQNVPKASNAQNARGKMHQVWRDSFSNLSYRRPRDISRNKTGLYVLLPALGLFLLILLQLRSQTRPQIPEIERRGSSKDPVAVRRSDDRAKPNSPDRKRTTETESKLQSPSMGPDSKDAKGSRVSKKGSSSTEADDKPTTKNVTLAERPHNDKKPMNPRSMAERSEIVPSGKSVAATEVNPSAARQVTPSINVKKNPPSVTKQVNTRGRDAKDSSTSKSSLGKSVENQLNGSNGASSGSQLAKAVPNFGVLSLQTVPGGVPVYLGRDFVGKTSQDGSVSSLKVNPGPNVLRIPSIKIGGTQYEGITRKVFIDPSRPLQLGAVSLNAIRTLSVYVAGPGVIVRINGDPYAIKDKPIVLNIPEGNVDIDARASNGKQLRKTIELKGENISLNTSLE